MVCHDPNFTGPILYVGLNLEFSMSIWILFVRVNPIAIDTNIIQGSSLCKNSMNPSSDNCMSYKANKRIKVAAVKNRAAMGICQIGLGLSEMMVVGYMFQIYEKT